MADWCNYYNAWCDEAEDITDGVGGCDYNCNDCENCFEVKKDI